MDQDYDVIVVGARVAGSTVAAVLGDAGYRVLLVDRSTFPSPTLSTHFFRGYGLLTVLKRLGILDEVLALGSPPLVHEYFYVDGSSQPAINPPQNPGDVGYCLSVRREPLDHILVRRACQSPTVYLAERTRVTELLWEGERVAGVRLAYEGGERSVRARIVVGADGRHSFVARSVNAAVEESDPAYRALYYCYVRSYAGQNGGDEPDGPEFSILGDEIAYVFPSDGGMTCVALSINRVDYARMKKAYQNVFMERIARHKGVAERFAAASLEGRMLGCGPERNYVRVPTGPGWALVGDAGMHQDPWSGHGMDMASVHGSFLADSILDWFNNTASEAEALSDYHRRRNEHGLETYRETVRLARDLRQLVQPQKE